MGSTNHQLASEALIELRGDKIAQFLQGQITCDTRALGPAITVPGALCTIKGRVISDLRVVHVDDLRCLLRVRRGVAQKTAETLQKYAQFSRITVQVLDGPSIIGIRLDPLDAGPSLPTGRNSALVEDSQIVLRASERRVEILPLSDSDARLPVDAEPGPESHFHADALADGDYAIEAIDSEVFTPQQLNYDLTGRVAFDKGCYTGQEVVARLHYKGRSKRRLRVYHLDGDRAPQRDAAINDANGSAIGAVLRSEAAADAHWVVAAQVQADRDDTPLYLADGTTLYARTDSSIS